MKELGEKEHDFHREVAQWPCTDAIDIIHTVGPLMQSLHDVLPDGKRGQHFEDRPPWPRRPRIWFRQGCRVVKGIAQHEYAQSC